MKLIKPLQLGLLTRPYTLGGKHNLAVAALGFFRLGEPCTSFLSEPEQWAGAVAALPPLKALDEVFAKPHGEMLLAGHAYAPDGTPADRVDLRLQLGSVSKSARVWGDRRWYYAPWYRITPAVPFLSMPLAAGRAYGGPRHPLNPEGRGYTGNPFAGWLGSNEGAMPNLELPDAPVRGHVRRGRPVFFGPLDPSRPQRRRRAGNYGKRWQLTEAPGLPSDLDPRFFQTAPDDQWNDGPWRGDEAYRLENLHPRHPLIEGRLPGFAARAFIRSNADASVQELAMALDTVWFFPDLLLGVAVYHGAAGIGDCDGLDVDAALVAYERPEEARPASHYERVLALRTDPATAIYHALSDQPLLPAEDEEVLALRAAGRAARRQSSLLRRQAVLDELMAEHWLKAGTPPPAGFVPPKVKASPFEIDLEAVRDGEVDLGEWIGRIKADADRRREEALARLESLPQKPTSALDLEKEKLRLYERAAKPAWDLLDVSLQPVPETDKSPARAQFARMPALERRGRRAALKASGPPLAPDLATWLGFHVRQWRLGGICLAGRDLAGADLQGVDFSDADLRETIFEGCDLRGARFAGADLRRTSFVGARLDGADFTGCPLAEANLSACTASGARFVGADLSKAWLMNADLSRAVLEGATLDEVLGHRAVLAGASLRGARLFRAVLPEMDAPDSVWQGAELSTCVLLKANLVRADFREARLTRCVLLDAVFDESDWRGARLERCLAIGASFKSAKAAGLRSKGSGFRGSDWRSADLSGALCSDSDFGNVRLDGADLRRGVFARSLFQGATLAKVQAGEADFWQALCRRADFEDADLRDVNLRHAALDGARFEGADLRGSNLDEHQRRKLSRKREEARL